MGRTGGISSDIITRKQEEREGMTAYLMAVQETRDLDRNINWKGILKQGW